MRKIRICNATLISCPIVISISIVMNLAQSLIRCHVPFSVCDTRSIRSAVSMQFYILYRLFFVILSFLPHPDVSQEREAKKMRLRLWSDSTSTQEIFIPVALWMLGLDGSREKKACHDSREVFIPDKVKSLKSGSLQIMFLLHQRQQF